MSGSLKSLEWLKEHDYTLFDMHATQAAASGHIHILKWFRKQLINPRPYIVNEISRKGDLEIVKWMNETLPVVIPYDAAENVLEWAKENGNEITVDYGYGY